MDQSSYAVRKDVATGIVRRKDGSVRQRIVQEHSGNDIKVLERGYFAPGTPPDQATEENIMYHWADAFTDAELQNEMVMEDIAKLRLEAVKANDKKEFVHKRD